VHKFNNILILSNYHINKITSVILCYREIFFCQVSAGVPPDGEQNGLMGRVDEGVDEFFTKKVTKMDSK